MIWKKQQNCSMANFQDFSSSWKLRNEQVKKVTEVWYMRAVTDDEIARIISRWTGIPVAKLTEGERTKTSASGR